MRSVSRDFLVTDNGNGIIHQISQEGIFQKKICSLFCWQLNGNLTMVGTAKLGAQLPIWQSWVNDRNRGKNNACGCKQSNQVKKLQQFFAIPGINGLHQNTNSP